MMKKNKRTKFNKYLEKKRFKRKKYLHNNNLKFKINSKTNKLLFIFFLSILIILNILIKKNSIKYNDIHIAISINNNYVYPCIVLLTSLLVNKHSSSFYKIHILTNNSTKNNSLNKINKVKETFGKNSVEIKFYNLEGDFTGASIHYFPISAYYRVALPSLLPEVDKIIYLDTDTLNFKDLSEIYNIKFKNKMYICATLDFFKTVQEINKFGIYPNKYINSGIMLLNLKEIRKDGIEKKIRDFIHGHFLSNADQTAINAVCHNNIQILSYKYATLALDSFEKLVELNSGQNPIYRSSESELKQGYNEPILFHYYAGYKPWRKEYTNFRKVYWWYYAKMSGFYQEILDRYYFNKDYIEKLLKQIPEDGGLLKRNYKKLN